MTLKAVLRMRPLRLNMAFRFQEHLPSRSSLRKPRVTKTILSPELPITLCTWAVFLPAPDKPGKELSLSPPLTVQGHLFCRAFKHRAKKVKAKEHCHNASNDEALKSWLCISGNLGITFIRISS